MIRDREVLFDQDRAGIPFDGEDQAADAIVYNSNFSLIGPGTEILLNTNAIPNGKPLMFEPALRFEAGQELNAYLSIVKTGTHTYTDNADDQGFILQVRQ
ncbi:unnamed protein product [marine sediment metagenome]|uniref:Uncharacterized protein n=1 Tax=marine sediment metagenome TaxID=412755 RepID=X1RYX5_9ZZZZ